MNIDLLKGIIVSLIASSLLTFGAVFVARTILAFAKKLKVWWIGLCIALAVLFIAAGVLCLIFRDKVVDICYLVLGGVLIIVGAGEIWLTIKRAMEANSIGIEQKGPAEEVRDNPKKDKKDKKKKKEPEPEVKPQAEVFDNDVPEEKPVLEIDVSSDEPSEDKNELVVKE